MSYDASTKTITTPVSEYDVQQALNTTEKDSGKLCTNENINKWARYKPVHYPELFSNNDGKGVVDMDTQTSKKVCGLTIPVITSGNGPSASADPQIFLNFYKNNNWEYDGRPTGGTNSPYRLADFDKYFHGALPPLRTEFVEGDIKEFNINSEAFVINMKTIGGEIGADVISSLNPTNIRPVAVFYSCNNRDDRWDMTNWEYKKLFTLEGTSWDNGSITVNSLKNNGVNIEDGLYYAVVIYLTEINGQRVSFLLPWDANNYFATVYHTVVMSWLQVKDYIIMRFSGEDSHTERRFTPTNPELETVSSIPNEFYLYFPILQTYRGYNGLQRDLIFGDNTSRDQLGITINGFSNKIYPGIVVDSTYHETTKEISLNDDERPVNTSMMMKFSTGSDSPWIYNGSVYQTNTITVLFSHDYGATWQSTNSTEFEFRRMFRNQE